MTKLKTIMVINGARGLLYDLLGNHQFSDDDENRILRCAADLSDCVKKSDENVTQTDLRNIEDLQAEINRLREALENITKSFDNLKSYYPQTYLFAEDCKRRIKQALSGESEG